MLRIRIVRNWLYGMRRILATLCLALLATGIGYKAIFGANGMKVYAAKRAEQERLRRQLEQYQLENQELQKRVKALATDAKTIEKEAREQLGYVKPGETVLVQTPLPRDTNATNVAQEQPH